MVKWIGLVLMTPKTCDNHGQRDKQTEFINRVKREQISLRTKLVISFNQDKINTIEPHFRQTKTKDFLSIKHVIFDNNLWLFLF